MNIFPMIQPKVTVSVSPLPMAKEVAWDFEKDLPVIQKGEPVFVEGANAVAVWAWNTLHTVRYRHPIFTWQYGCELERLIGQPYSADTKKAEAIRYVRDALIASPYITDVKDITVDFSHEGTLTVSCQIETVYGPLTIERMTSNV